MSAAIAEREDHSLELIVATLGGWPMIDRRWDDSQFNVTMLLGRLRAVYGYTPLVLMYVGVDEKNSTAHRILVGYTLRMTGDTSNSAIDEKPRDAFILCNWRG